MKTIAVLTDFSARSIHAARYAILLAQTIKADILLFNAFLVPSSLPAASIFTAWPANEYEEIKKDTETQLAQLRDILDHELNTNSVKGTYLPEITFKCDEGPVVNTMPLLAGNKDIILLVAATHGADALTTFVMGNNCTELIGHATLPILLVPENAPVENMQSLIFATDLDKDDIKYINSVAGLAKQFYAFITLVNVDPEIPSDIEHNKKVNAFMQQMVLKVDYRRISYRNIPVQNIQNGLFLALKNEKPDLLVMVHRKAQQFGFFNKHSVTKAVVRYTSLPVLVFSYPQEVVPQF